MHTLLNVFLVLLSFCSLLCFINCVFYTCLLHQVGALFIEANSNGIFFHGFTESKAKLVDGYNSWDNKLTVLTVPTPQGKVSTNLMGICLYSISEIWGGAVMPTKKLIC